jgi:hypothetical protein
MGLETLLISLLAGAAAAFGFYAYHRPDGASPGRTAGERAVCRAVEGGSVAVGATVASAVMVLLWAFPAGEGQGEGQGQGLGQSQGGRPGPPRPSAARTPPAEDAWAYRNAYRYRPRRP